MTPTVPPLRSRARRFWQRHRTLFWALHSVWALLTGVVVVVLAHERYAFVPWVVVFLGITWLSTLFFGGRPVGGPPDAAEGDDPAVPGLGVELTSYVTRTLYQETLFFLIPFYAYSTVLASPNVGFTALLVALALLSCLDLVFDRWLRTSAVFGMVFFATVAFAALNLILPIVFGLAPRLASPFAAIVAVGSAVPLAWRASGGLWPRVRLGGAAAGLVALGVLAPTMVPPVPLRMTDATFAQTIDRETLALTDTLASGDAPPRPDGAMIVVVEVFAPATVPTTVSLDWSRDGEHFRTSKDISISAHAWGFRVWDGWSPDPDGTLPAGRYRVVLRTSSGRVFGVATLDVVEA